MFTFETADPQEVRRCRMAQFSGRMATVTPDGATVTGLVHAVMEVEASVPRRWRVAIIPMAPKQAARRRPPKINRS